jgi:hypothetical protein
MAQWSGGRRNSFAVFGLFGPGRVESREECLLFVFLETANYGPQDRREWRLKRVEGAPNVWTGDSCDWTVHRFDLRIMQCEARRGKERKRSVEVDRPLRRQRSNDMRQGRCESGYILATVFMGGISFRILKHLRINPSSSSLHLQP